MVLNIITMERSIHIYIHTYIHIHIIETQPSPLFSFSIERAKSYSECARCYTRVSRAFIRCLPMASCVCVCLCVCVCVCVCVRERERGEKRERDRKRETEKEREREKERGREKALAGMLSLSLSLSRSLSLSLSLSLTTVLKSLFAVHELNLVRKIDNRNISHALKIVLSLKIEDFEN